MPKGELLDAGIAEVYSSVLAVMFGTFVSLAIKTILPPDNTIPVWSDAFGVFMGFNDTNNGYWLSMFWSLFIQ